MQGGHPQLFITRGGAPRTYREAGKCKLGLYDPQSLRASNRIQCHLFAAVDCDQTHYGRRLADIP